MSIFAFDQRVYLRRDPSQFGRIGVGMFGGNLDATGTCQFVFWEHENADIVTQEPIVDLMSEAEYHERRRLFFAAMRRPEMRLLRAALWDLKWEHGIEWRTLTQLTIDLCFAGWMLITDHHLSFCYDPDDPHPFFHVLRLHDADDPRCPCEDCREERACA